MAQKKKTTKKSKSSAKKTKPKNSSRVAKAKPKAKPKAKAKSKAKGKAATKAKPKTATKAKKKAPPKAASKTTAAKASHQAPKRPEVDPLSRLKTKPLQKKYLDNLAKAIRDAVLPVIQAGKGRDIVGKSPSGDATFELDKVAERALLVSLRASKIPVAYYSEDAGYTTFASGQPKNLLVIDPIDGTRAAKLGFEGCAVAICSTRIIERPKLGDLDNALVLDLFGNRSFYAERNKGARVYVEGHPRKPKLSSNANLERMTWSMTVAARPAELIFPTAAKLIDVSSLMGGFFACNSTSYSLTRLLTGQLDACIDVANRFYRDIPKVVEDSFINAGRGEVLGICPYDFAGAVMIAKEAGCVVTDAYGESLDDTLLLDSSVVNQRSMVAAANSELHDKLMNYIGTRIEQYEAGLKRRYNAAKAK